MQTDVSTDWTAAIESGSTGCGALAFSLFCWSTGADLRAELVRLVIKNLSPVCPHTTTLFTTPAICVLFISPRGRVMIRGCVSTWGRSVTERGMRKVLQVKAGGGDVENRQMNHYLPLL